MKHCPFTIQAAELFWSWELQKFKSDVPPEQEMLQIPAFNIHLKLLDTDLS